MYEKEPDFGQIKKLWTLKLVVELGSLKRASARSKVSVSAVSQSLTGLEKSLGRKLLYRKDRQLIPTQYCLDLLSSLQPAFNIFTGAEELKSCALNVPKMEWLNLGVCDVTSTPLVSGLTRNLKEKLPKLKLTYRIGRCSFLTKMVKKGDLCMAVVADNDSMKGVTIFPLYEDRLGLYCSSEHAVSKLGIEAINKLGVATLIPETEGHPLHYSQFVKMISPKFSPILSSDSLDSLYAIAASGTMLAILPERYAMRTPGVLKEIILPKYSAEKKTGHFKVNLVSQKTCDPMEDQFLLTEILSLI